jgi:hypothetical protein
MTTRRKKLQDPLLSAEPIPTFFNLDTSVAAILQRQMIVIVYQARSETDHPCDTVGPSFGVHNKGSSSRSRSHQMLPPSILYSTAHNIAESISPSQYFTTEGEGARTA